MSEAERLNGSCISFTQPGQKGHGTMRELLTKQIFRADFYSEVLGAIDHLPPPRDHPAYPKPFTNCGGGRNELLEPFGRGTFRTLVTILQHSELPCWGHQITVDYVLHWPDGSEWVWPMVLDETAKQREPQMRRWLDELALCYGSQYREYRINRGRGDGD